MSSFSIHRSPFVVGNQDRIGKNALSCISNDSAFDSLMSLSRGGNLDDESEYDYESEEEVDIPEDDEEEEEEKQAALSESTISKTQKIQSKKEAKAASKSKAAINASLQKTKKKKSSGSLLKKMGIPYIVRACMNPLTVLAMTKAYFASLFNIAYLEEDSSQGLRSALEAKAKKDAASGGAGNKKGKRSMKPGRSKSLADLPALSA